MKRLIKTRLELVLLVSLAVTIFLMVVFFNQVLIVITLFVYAQMIPFDIVFAPDVDKSQIDASQIINCLHGGICPSGITYVDDETGKIEDTAIPDQQPPNLSPESQIMTISNNVPSSVSSLIPSADNVVYLIYILLIVLLIVSIIILLKRRSRKPKIV